MNSMVDPAVNQVVTQTSSLSHNIVMKENASQPVLAIIFHVLSKKKQPHVIVNLVWTVSIVQFILYLLFFSSPAKQ